MKSAYYIQFIFLICISHTLLAQTQPGKVQPTEVEADSLPETSGSSPIRGLVKFSADTLEDLVNYSARDSIRFDNVNHLIYLYGEASIKYQSYSITADFIRVNLDSSEALAEQWPDSLKRKDPLSELRDQDLEDPEEEELEDAYLLDAQDSLYYDTLDGPIRDLNASGQGEKKERNEDGRPHFDDGSNQFDADRLRYNFKTLKGKVYQVETEEQAGGSNMFIKGTETKFISGGPDSNSTDFIYSQDVIITSCNAPKPHYGIRSKKQKIIPNRQVIVGPSNVEIAGVPTPLVLPFGFFPLSQGAKNGLIFPSDYEYSDQWGFGLRDVGYYFPISDYIDLTLTGDIYFNGSWGLRARSKYRKRYKYNGNIDIGYSDRIQEVVPGENQRPVDQHQRSFSIRWSHSQDQRSRPGQTFSASVSMQTNGYEQLNYNDAARVLNNQYNSNVSFRKKFIGTPFSISANVRHSQNTRTGDMQFTLPDVNVNMNRIFPFERKRKVGQPKWYERISLQYVGKFLNRIRTQDSLLFDAQTWQNTELGFNHKLNSSASFQIFKYFNITPSVNYDESWYFEKIRRTFDPNFELAFDTIFNPLDSTDFQIISDTLSYGEVVRDTVNGFAPLRQFTSSISLTTNIFGSLGVGRKKGWFRGIRHVVKPTISLNYSPDYQNPNLDYVGFVQTDIRNPDDLQLYSLFENPLFGSAPTTGPNMNMSYSIQNLLEAKIFSKKDSTEQKVKLFNTLSITGSHNFVADSLKWSQVRMSGNTQFFKGISRWVFSASWDPYALNENGRRINEFYYKTDGKLLRFERAAIRVSNGLTIDQIKRLLKGEDPQQNSSRGRGGQSNAPASQNEESITDLFKNFRINHEVVMMWDSRNGGKFDLRTNALNTRGNIRMTPNWDLSIGNIGYDFVTKRLTYPYLGFTRNLHCWELSFQWAPQRGTYMFNIRVREGPLNFLKIPYSKNNQDTRFR